MKGILKQIDSSSIISKSKQFLINNWIRETLFDNYVLIYNPEELGRVSYILTLEDITKELQLERKSIFIKNGLKVLYYEFDDGYDYEIKNDYDLELVYSKFLNTHKGIESVEEVELFMKMNY